MQDDAQASRRGFDSNFILQKKLVPSTEYTDSVTFTDLDLRQEALVRFWLLGRKYGYDIDEEDDLIEYIDNNKGLVWTCFSLEWKEAYRTLKGWTKTDKRKMQVSSIELEEGGIASRVSDHRQDSERNTIELDLPRLLRHWYCNGEVLFYNLVDKWKLHISSGCTLDVHHDYVREAIELMIVAQQKKALGQPLPMSVRQALSRSRKKTGLALDVSLL